MNSTKQPATASIVQLGERAHEVIEITELEPNDGTFVGKRVNRNGSITQYPLITWWKQSVARVPASVSHVFAYLREARTRNICLIRGAPANLARQPTRRWRAYEVKQGKDRGDHGFTDEPSKLFWFDVDGAEVKWKDDAEGAVKNIVAQLGEPWASTSFVWFFSATHGLEFDEHKRWTERISDGVVRARLGFITERALTADEASALTKIVQVRVAFKLDPAITRVVQPNYIRRPHWGGHPDVLGDIPTIGWVRGTFDYLAIPDDLTHQARWAKAQGHHVDIAEHPDAEAAVRGIGSDGRVREHLKAAVKHLLLANPPTDVVSFVDHSIAIVDELQRMLEQHRAEIEENLARHNRHWSEVLHYLSGMPDWAHWLLNHPSALNRKTIKLSKEERAEAKGEATREAIFRRVAHTIERARKSETIDGDPLDPYEVFANEIREILGTPPVVLLVAPTGSGKSTVVRANALRYVAEHPKKTVVILMPRHKLGDEQIKLLRKEHPNADFNAAVWRGRHAWNPNIGDGHEERMCQRSEEAKEVEKAMLNVEHHLCKQGRGEKEIKCPLYDVCAYQQQKLVAASIWFAAHECAVHEMPKAFGKVGWVIFDESPLDAFTFGVDDNDEMVLALDDLQSEVAGSSLKAKQLKLWGWHDMRSAAERRGNPLSYGRKKLHRVLSKLSVPTNPHQGAPVPYEHLGDLPNRAREFYQLEWKEKVVPNITPDMDASEVHEKLTEASDNRNVKKRATLWKLIEEATPDKLIGCIQVHRSDKGRMIRMVGLRPIAEGWNVQTLICDATGDAELLRAIWPELETDESVQGWQQLPRPKSVRVFQCVDRSISKWAVAVEGKELERKIEGARRLYAALLMRTLEYGGADGGVIVYKSTEMWIRENCFVPQWLKLYHHGDVTGTNALETVRAEFVIGRPLASPEDVTRMTEALFGAYVPEREYVVRKKRGRIPIVPDAGGNNTVRVDVWEHPHPLAERVRRQVTEAALIQAVGRARAGLRGEGGPLDLHLWTDVPVPELGQVEPVLWNELEVGLDGLMLATGGVWLESSPHAAQAYDGLFSVDGLKSARKGREGVFLIRNPISRTPSLHLVRYQKAGRRQRPTRALVLAGIDARAWLEERLGPLARCEVEGEDVRTSA